MAVANVLAILDREAVRNAIATDLRSERFKELLKSIWVAKGFKPEEVPFPVDIHPAVRWQPQQFPCAEVAVTQGRINNPDRRDLDYTYQVVVFWHDNHSDELLLEDRLDRLVLATQELYKAQPNLSPTLKGAVIWLGDDDTSPLMRWGEENRPFVKSMAQELYVRVYR